MRYAYYVFTLGILVFIASQLTAQTTFSKRYHFDAPPTIATSLHTTDSCYYFSGIVSDPERWTRGGLLFGRLNLLGEVEFQRKYFIPGKSVENWFTPLVYSDTLNAFFSIGRGGDSIGNFNFRYILGIHGDVSDQLYYRSPYLPSGSIIEANDFIINQNKEIVVLESSFVERNNPMGLTPGYNYTIRHITLNGDFLETNTQEHDWNLLPQKVIAQDSHYFVSYQRSNDNITSTSESIESYGYIDKFDQQLNWIGRVRVGLDDERGIYDMLPTADGGLVAVGVRGSRYPFNGGTRESLRWDRAYVQKRNRFLQVSWDTEFTVPFPYLGNQSRLSHLVVAPDSSGYVATGFCSVFLEEYRRPAELGWIVKTNLRGDSLWRRFLFHDFLDSTYYNQEIYDLKVTPDGGYLMCGFASERGNPVAPGQHAWFVKVDSEGCLVPNCGLVNTQEPDEVSTLSLNAYPNPGTDALYLHVQGLSGRKCQVQMTNIHGQVFFLRPLPLDDTTYVLDVPDYPAGMYYITVLDVQGQPLNTISWIKQ